MQGQGQRIEIREGRVPVNVHSASKNMGTLTRIKQYQFWFGVVGGLSIALALVAWEFQGDFYRGVSALVLVVAAIAAWIISRNQSAWDLYELKRTPRQRDEPLDQRKHIKRFVWWGVLIVLLGITPYVGWTFLGAPLVQQFVKDIERVRASGSLSTLEILPLAISLASLATSLVSLIGFAITTVLAWRKEKRETIQGSLDERKKLLEIEKLERDARKPSREARRRSNNS